MSLFSLLGVARDGIAAQTTALGTVGSNVANVATPGYARRRVVLESRAEGGAGVNVQGVERVYDRFAQGRVVSEQGRQGAAMARADALDEAQSIVAPGAGQTIADRLAGVFSAFADLAAQPGDATARGAVLSRAEDLANAISGSAAALEGTRDRLLGRAQGVAGEINERLTRIASLGNQIVQAMAQGDDASSLRDQRDQLVSEVGQRIDVRSVEDAQGGLTLLSSGVVLADRSGASMVDVSQSPGGGTAIGVTRPGGSHADITTRIGGGTLAGLREARDVDVPAVQHQLDQVASDLATAFNAVHQTAFGADGVTGRPLFTPPGGVPGAALAFSVDASVKGQPNAIGASFSAANLPGGNDAAVAIGKLAGVPLSGKGSPAEALAAISGDLGLRKSSADAEVTLRESTVGQATALRDRASGVSIDEEMVDMTRFQRAFEASTRVLRTADELLAGLIRDLLCASPTRPGWPRCSSRTSEPRRGCSTSRDRRRRASGSTSPRTTRPPSSR